MIHKYQYKDQYIVMDINSGAVLKELRGGMCSEGYSGISVTWGADGRIYAASMGTKILAWDGTTYDPIENFSALGAGGSWINHLTAASSGSLIAQHDSMGEPVVMIIDGPKNRQLHRLDSRGRGGGQGRRNDARPSGPNQCTTRYRKVLHHSPLSD
jgi:hypothetical protein